MIKPTVGRVVHYFPSDYDRTTGMVIHDASPLTALIVYVWSDTCINLVVFDHEGNTCKRTSVAINVEGSSPHAEWMAYQVGQAAKYDALAAKVEK